MQQNLKVQQIYENLEYILVSDGNYDQFSNLEIIVSRAAHNKTYDEYHHYYEGDYQKLVSNRITEKTLLEIDEDLSKLDNETLDQIIFYAVRIFSARMVPSRENAFISQSLTNLVIDLLKFNSGDMLVDFGSGIGGFILNAMDYLNKQNCVFKDVTGIEINKKFADFSKMLLSALPGTVCTTVMNKNILDLGNDFVRCNKGFTYPPLGITTLTKDNSVLSTIFPFKFTNKNSTEWVFVDRMLSALNYSWRGVAIVSANALFNSNDKEYRDLLFENKLIEGIIELPVGAISSVSTKCFLIIFKKDCANVKILDASNDFYRDAYNKWEVDFKRISNEYFGKNIFSLKSEQLVNAENLTPSSLLLKVKYNNTFKDKNVVKLGDVANVFSGSQYTIKNFADVLTEERTGYRILTSSDINDGIVDWDSLPFINYHDNKFDKFAINKGDLIITSKSSKYKTVVVDIEPKEKILVTGGMIIIRPSDELNPYYLKSFFDSHLGKTAITAIQKGVTIISINAKDLKEVIIPRISIEKQKKIAKKYVSAISSIAAYKLEIESLQKKIENILDDELEDY